MGKNGYLAKRQENFKKIYERAIKRTAMVMIKNAVITLNDEFGFAEKRADRFLTKLKENFDAYGKSSLEDTELTDARLDARVDKILKGQVVLKS